MEEIEEFLKDTSINNTTNIHTIDSEKQPEPMAPPGSVQGEIIYVPPVLTEEEQQKLDRKNFLMKVKIIALDILNKPLLTNPKDMMNKDRRLLISTCQEVIDNLTSEVITTKFNDIVCNDIFDRKNDYTALPISPY